MFTWLVKVEKTQEELISLMTDALYLGEPFGIVNASSLTQDN